MKENNVYGEIAEKLGYAGSASFIKVLEVVMTPEEGKLLLELLVPTTCQQLARRLKVDEKNLSAKLDNLVRRGLLRRGKTEYVFQIGIHGGFSFIPHNTEEYIPPDYLRVFKEFRREVAERETANALQRFQTTGHQIHRVFPARLAIAASPKIRPEQVLWYEDIAEILKREEIIALVDCPCRRRQQNCNKPLWNCLHFGRGAEYDLSRGSRMIKVSVDEALAMSDLAEQAGLVHEGPVNYADVLPGVICNCCPCCCGMLVPALASGRLHELYTPSRFQASVDEEQCTGCQECVERCPFDAIKMVKPESSKKMKAKVIEEECFGCGVCVVGCKQKALTFELVRPPEHIPPASTAPIRTAVQLK